MACLVLVGCAGHRVALVPEGRYSVLVIVETADRTRIAHVDVAIGDETCRTDALGACRLTLAAGDHHLRVVAPGYGPYDSAVRVVTDVMIRVPVLGAHERE